MQINSDEHFRVKSFIQDLGLPKSGQKKKKKKKKKKYISLNNNRVTTG